MKWNTPKYTLEETSKATRQAGAEGIKRFQDTAFGLSVHWDDTPGGTSGPAPDGTDDPYAVIRLR